MKDIMRDSLRELRHAALPAGFKDPSALLEFTLGCIHDTPEELRQRLSELQDGLQVLEQLDGLPAGRHATIAVSRRALQVVERKFELLTDVSRRLEAFKEASLNKASVLKQVAAGGSIGKLIGLAADFLQSVRAATHQGGNPEAAIKLEFDRFVTSFGLAKDHVFLRRAKEMFLQEERAWGEAVLDESELVAAFFRRRDADDDTPARAIKRMIDTAVALGFRRDGEHLGKAWLCALNTRRLAAKRRIHKESLAALQPAERPREVGLAGGRPRVAFSSEAVASTMAQAWASAMGASSSASKAAASNAEARADRVVQEICKAVEFGVPPIQLQEELSATDNLRSEGVRWRAIAEMTTAVPVLDATSVVQPATPRSLQRQTEAAERVADACKAAVGDGLSWDNPNLREAWKMAKSAIADVGFQKRLENSEAAARRRLQAREQQDSASVGDGRGLAPMGDEERVRVLAELRQQLLEGLPRATPPRARAPQAPICSEHGASTAPCSRERTPRASSKRPAVLSARRVDGS